MLQEYYNSDTIFYYNSGTTLGVVGIPIDKIGHTVGSYRLLKGAKYPYNWIRISDLKDTREEAEKSIPAKFCKLEMQPFQYNDGGRSAAGYQGKAGDCVARAVAIVSGLPYQQVYDELAEGNLKQRKTKRSRKGNTGKRSAAHGINTKRKWFEDYMVSLGFKWVPTMAIGKGCTVHLRADELPKGRLVVNVSKHFTAVIDGVIQDTHDCSRAGTRCVYGYYIWENESQVK